MRRASFAVVALLLGIAPAGAQGPGREPAAPGRTPRAVGIPVRFPLDRERLDTLVVEDAAGNRVRNGRAVPGG